MATTAIPAGYHSITPYLFVKGVPRLIEFLKQAFDAAEVHRQARPDGTIMNAELRIGDSMLMMGEMPPGRQPMPAMLYLYVNDADTVYHQAVRAGGISVMEPTDQFYGDRSGAVDDPSGNQWWIATRKADLSSEEIATRSAQHKR